MRNVVSTKNSKTFFLIGILSFQSLSFQEECYKLLVKLCQEKLASLVDEVNESDSLFAHLIDEALIFEEEVKKFIPGLAYSDRCVQVLFQDDHLEKWLELEKNCKSINNLN